MKTFFLLGGARGGGEATPFPLCSALFMTIQTKLHAKIITENDKYKRVILLYFKQPLIF